MSLEEVYSSNQDLPPDEGETQDTEPQTGPVADNMRLVSDLVDLMDQFPDLRADIANLIDSKVKGSVSVSEQNTGAAAPTVSPTGGAVPTQVPMTAPASMPSPTPMGTPQIEEPQSPYEARIAALEASIARGEFDRELAEAKGLYENLNKQFGGLLPAFDENTERAIAQISIDNQGLPLHQAAQIFAMQQVTGGQGDFVERLLAQKAGNAKAAALPRVEGPGGAVSSGQQEPPKTIAEAKQRALEYARAFFGKPPGTV